MAKISGSSPQAVMDEYGMPYLHMAEALYNRSKGESCMSWAAIT